MNFPDRATVGRIKREYPAGTKVRLLMMEDKFAPPVGTVGEVYGVDDTASLLVHWSNGSSLNVIYDVDRVERID